MFQVNGNSFLSKSLRNYIMARFMQKDFYMNNKDKVNRSNDKKQRNVCQRKKLGKLFRLVLALQR